MELVGGGGEQVCAVEGAFCVLCCVAWVLGVGGWGEDFFRGFGG